MLINQCWCTVSLVHTKSHETGIQLEGFQLKKIWKCYLQNVTLFVQGPELMMINVDWYLIPILHSTVVTYKAMVTNNSNYILNSQARFGISFYSIFFLDNYHIIRRFILYHSFFAHYRATSFVSIAVCLEETNYDKIICWDLTYWSWFCLSTCQLTL